MPRADAREAQLRRLTRFFRALSDMDKAVVRLADPDELYRVLCTIAVESGHAAMAWIGLLEEDRVVPVAWAGGAREYTSGLAIRALGARCAEGLAGPTALAIARDSPCICNDLFDDERAAPWRARAREFGVRASAAFPIRRGGRAVGALNIYFAEAGPLTRP